MSCGCGNAYNGAAAVSGGGKKQKQKQETRVYLPKPCKCSDGYTRRVFKIPGKGNTLYVMYKGRVTKKSDIPK